MKSGIAAFLLLLCVAPSRAWEPSNVEAITERIKELDRSFAGKNEEKLAALKYKLARQKKRPAWADKTSWVEESKYATLTFGVGIAEGIKSETLRLSAAQGRASASLVKQRQGMEVKETVGPNGSVTRSAMASGTVTPTYLDWYAEKEDGKDVLYVLAVTGVKNAP
jgi:hypothetical protein